MAEKPRKTRETQLGVRLRSERLRRRMNQYEAAEWFDVSQASLNRWELGDRPRAERFPKIGEFIGASTEEVWNMINGNAETLSLQMIREKLAAMERDMADLRRAAASAQIAVRASEEQAREIESLLGAVEDLRRRVNGVAVGQTVVDGDTIDPSPPPPSPRRVGAGSRRRRSCSGSPTSANGR